MAVISEFMHLLATHDTLLWFLAAFSILMFLGSLLALPIIIARLPEDYFSAPSRRLLRGEQRPLPYWLMIAGKNLLGALLLVLGVLMLVLPGQGLLTLSVGIMLLNFPGKYRLERWLVSRPPVLNTLNWIRHKKHRPPLRNPRSPTIENE
ncbi:hypothetical protein [Marinimicrobium sp. ABcell2]|uniref:hypothetical protein n=1 Tax=Marinimicrobium sp. ABcell2 TaxID=3069751 RepID=UPI0027B08B7A|nr:hypothetical protein [Marinimicrobium sp. ABcell2]MDQ2076213.1 hypothetical protein [Marinimicrobium sp. ABcell2]